MVSSSCAKDPLIAHTHQATVLNAVAERGLKPFVQHRRVPVNNHAKSNVVASSSSLDSTNDSLSQVTLEQENSLLKGIIEKGVYKSLVGSKQFEEIVSKQGRHRKNQGIGFERKFNAEGVEWEEGQYPTPQFVSQKEKYDPTSSNVEQAQDDLPPQDHKLKAKDKLQEEIDAFIEAPQAMVKWVPKDTSSSTSSSSTTTPRIPIKMMWIPKKKNQKVLEGDSANKLHSYSFWQELVQSTSTSCTCSWSHKPSCW